MSSTGLAILHKRIADVESNIFLLGNDVPTNQILIRALANELVMMLPPVDLSSNTITLPTDSVDGQILKLCYYVNPDLSGNPISYSFIMTGVTNHILNMSPGDTYSLVWSESRGIWIPIIGLIDKGVPGFRAA